MGDGEKWVPEPGDFGPWSLEPSDLTAYVDAIRSWATDVARQAGVSPELVTKPVQQRPAWRMLWNDEHDAVHVVPTGDLVGHEVAQVHGDDCDCVACGCPCGPTASVSPGHDDCDHPDIWTHQHHAIDGRPLPHLR